MSTPGAVALSKAKRQKWREAFNPDKPLRKQLPWPNLRVWQAAHVMQVSESTVYESCKRFDAAMRLGDHGAAAREVPCLILGSAHRIPTEAFVEWWTSTGRATLTLLKEATS